MVSTILGAMAAGDSIETILEDYQRLTHEDCSAALEFASQVSDCQSSTYDAVA
jgi:uncharacterized protein (DUF433 family)